MPDSFLRLYRIARRLYTLTGRISFASIRDQCVRAELLANHISKHKRLNPDSTVLILGDGLTAAILTASFCKSASTPQVAVVRENDSFGYIQLNCGHRFIDPHVFDWPEKHHKKRSYPHTGSANVRWTASSSSDVAIQIDLATEKLITPAIAAGRVQIFDHHKLCHFHFDPSRQHWCVRIRAEQNQRPVHLKADIVIISGGLHLEQNSLRNFQSTGFWNPTDPLFELARQSIASRDQRPKKVLIIGSGDGALQDFVYLLSGESSARAILKQIPIPSRTIRILQSENNCYLRRYAAAESDDETLLWSSLQQRIEELCSELWQRTEIVNAVVPLVKNALQVHVQIACRNWCFSHSFLLNRILAGLFARAIPSGSPTIPVPFRMNVQALSFKSFAPPGFPLNNELDWAAYPVEVKFGTFHPAPRPAWSSNPNVSPLYTDAVAPAIYDRVLLRIGSPPAHKKVRAYRKLNHYFRRQFTAALHPLLIEDLPGIAFDPNRMLLQREIRQLPPFHPELCV